MRFPRLATLFLALAARAAAQSGPRLPACPQGPLVDTPPMALEDFIAFRPLGFLPVPIHIFPAKHSSFSLALPGEPTPERPVRFPGKAWVTEVVSTHYGDGRTGYQMVFRPCREFDIDERLKSESKRLPRDCYDFIDRTGTIGKCQARLLYDFRDVTVDGGRAGFAGFRNGAARRPLRTVIHDQTGNSARKPGIPFPLRVPLLRGAARHRARQGPIRVGRRRQPATWTSSAAS